MTTEQLYVALAAALTALGVAIAKLLRIYKIPDMASDDTETTPVDTPPPKFPPRILDLATAISLQEGAKLAIHNPGNLKVSTLTASWGAEKGFQATDGGWIAKFPTLAMGKDALCQFLVLGAENQLLAFHSPSTRTLAGFLRVYAGNPPQKYVNNIVAYMKVSPDTQISTFL